MKHSQNNLKLSDNWKKCTLGKNLRGIDER